MMPRRTKAQERRRKINIMVKKNDVFLLAGIALFSGVIFAVMALAGILRGSGGKMLVEVTIDGRLYGEFPLYEDTVVDIDEPLGHNTIVISGGQVCISEADCPDRYCVKHSAVSKIGETIICLPHKLVVEIKSYGKGAADTGVDAVVQ